MIQIQDITVRQGEKKQSYLAIEGGPSIPFTAICGAEAGKTLLITAGIHGAEYPGIAAAALCGQELQPEALCGNVIILHASNPTGVQQKMPALVPEDGKNLNRMFPGNPEGTASERIAWQITQLQLKSDFYMDLHSGDLHEDLIPYVYYPANCDAETSGRSFEIAALLDVRFMVKSNAASGAYNSAAKQGIPSLLLERGCCGLWTREEVDAFKQDIGRVMKALGMIGISTGSGCQNSNDSSPEATSGDLLKTASESSSKTIFEDAHYLESEREGLWYPFVKPGDRIKAGETLGEIRDFFGVVKESFSAKTDGIVLYQLSALAAGAGDITVAYGCLK